jgi:hypothetical protein
MVQPPRARIDLARWGWILNENLKSGSGGEGASPLWITYQLPISSAKPEKSICAITALSSKLIGSLSRILTTLRLWTESQFSMYATPKNCRYAGSRRDRSMITCDFCCEPKDCLQKEIEDKEYHICFECWNPVAQKLRGKGVGRIGIQSSCQLLGL